MYFSFSGNFRDISRQTDAWPATVYILWYDRFMVSWCQCRSARLPRFFIVSKQCRTPRFGCTNRKFIRIIVDKVSYDAQTCCVRAVHVCIEIRKQVVVQLSSDINSDLTVTYQFRFASITMVCRSQRLHSSVLEPFFPDRIESQLVTRSREYRGS